MVWRRRRRRAVDWRTLLACGCQAVHCSACGQCVGCRLQGPPASSSQHRFGFASLQRESWPLYAQLLGCSLHCIFTRAGALQSLKVQKIGVTMGEVGLFTAPDHRCIVTSA